MKSTTAPCPRLTSTMPSSPAAGWPLPISACTCARSWAARRPQANAARLFSTCWPLSSMARCIAASPSGSQPFW
ncbi:Uncharacterised protein [Bordetella pertussis]|nr:Uncharacterised protein [Bordetella pertussis]